MRTAFKIEPGELRATLLSFFFMLTLMASYYLLRPIRDAMSSNWTDAELSTLFSATFLFSILAVMLYGAACSRIRFSRMVPGVYGLFAASFVGFFLAVGSIDDAEWARKSFYVWISVFSLFHVSVFWSYMADIFSRDQAPRLFGFIAAGASIGAILGPAIAVTMVGAIGTSNLLLISASLLMIPIVVISSLEKERRQPDSSLDAQPGQQQAIGGNPFAGFSLFLKNPYLLAIGCFILLYTALSTFVYFELKNLLAGVEEVTRVKIWAGMDLAVNVLAIGTAMFGTSRLTTRFGLTTTLVLVPVLIVFGLLIVAIAPMIGVVVGLQVIRRAGNYAITRPGREMLFTIVDRETRFKAKSVIDIVVYRGGDAATAWAFTGLTQGLGLGLGAVAAVGAVLAVLWSFLALFLGRSYMKSTTEQDAKETLHEKRNGENNER
ncbi:MAG: NTP/NDP exchange transporter [Gammaproteobacteria bacterium]